MSEFEWFVASGAESTRNWWIGRQLPNGGGTVALTGNNGRYRKFATKEAAEKALKIHKKKEVVR